MDTLKEHAQMGEGDGEVVEARDSGDTCVGRLLEGEIVVQKRLVN